MQVRAPFSWRTNCWKFQETTSHPSLWPDYPIQDAVNRVLEILPGDGDLIDVRLQRAITPGECGTVTYQADAVAGGSTASATFCAHPGDVNADGCSGPVDIVALIDVLNGVSSAPWGEVSTNCNRDSATGASDIICLIDLLNSGWNGVGCD